MSVLRLLHIATRQYRPVLSNRKEVVAVATALMLPAFFAVAALAIDVSFWALRKAQLQRTVDFAARAGAQRYAATNDARRAADTAADLAELNGAVGGASRSWDAVNRRMTIGELTIRLTTGVNNPVNTAVHMTMTRQFSVTGLLNAVGPNVTINAMAVAEAHLNPPICIFGIGDINSSGRPVELKSGNPRVVLDQCATRSNGKIVVSSGGYLSGLAHFASKEIEGAGTIVGDRHPFLPLHADPYADHPQVQQALTNLATYVTMKGVKELLVKPGETVVAQPGIYSYMQLQGNTTFSPGIYYVQGDVSTSAQSGTISLAGQGVTIVFCGSLSATGGSAFNMTAATRKTAVGGAIPGFLLVGSSKCKKANSFTTVGTTSILNGVIYLPNGELSMGGNVEANVNAPAGGCLNIIAQYIV
ncbi:Tad domain-containing protein, partial [Siccirubricoccus deserti]